jgi:hypothetical protein
MPLGIKIILGVFLSIVLGIILISIAVGFEFITLKNIDKPLNTSILDGTITLMVGFLIYYYMSIVIGKYSAEFTRKAFPFASSTIKDNLFSQIITDEEVFERKKILHEYLQIMHTLDVTIILFRWSYVLITVIFVALSFVAYYKPIAIYVGKFAIFEMVTMIGLYFSILIYMYTIDKQAYKLSVKLILIK